MKYLNRLFDTSLQGVGANKTEKGVNDPMLANFDNDNFTAEKNMQLVLKQLYSVLRNPWVHVYKLKNP